MGPKTTPSLISKGGYQIPPPLGGREIDTPWEIGLKHWILPKDHFKTHLFFSIFGWGDKFKD